MRTMISLAPASISRLHEVTIDTSVLGFTLLATLLTGLIFGLAPALHASRPDLNESLKDGSKGSGESVRRHPLRSALVVGEIALSLVLLIGAGLLLKSFASLLQVKPGFSADNVMTMKLARPGDRWGGDATRAAFFKQVLDRVKNLPGVEHASFVSHLPLAGAEDIEEFAIEGRPTTKLNEMPMADMRSISPVSFSTLGIRLVDGRPFDEHDHAQSQPVVIISEGLAHRYWPNENPIGRRLKRGNLQDPGARHTIVGVVGDIKHTALDADDRPQLYWSYQQTPWAFMTLTLRSSVDLTNVTNAVRNEVWVVDRGQPITDIKPMRDYLAASVAPRRFNLLLLGAFAAIALILAAVGIYGVMSYTVAQRTHEIGIRMALGAQTNDVLKLILRHGLLLALIGITIGLLAAVGLTRLMTSLLYNVSATDPATFGLIALLLILVALLACYIPARRATRVDPMVALRYE